MSDVNRRLIYIVKHLAEVELRQARADLDLARAALTRAQDRYDRAVEVHRQVIDLLDEGQASGTKFPEGMNRT